MSTRIVLADHSAPVRAGLRVALRRGGLDVVGEAGDAVSLQRLERLADAHVLVLAVDLPGGGLGALSQVARAHPALRIIVLTPAPGDDELLAAVLAGACGYLARDVAADRLPTVVEAVRRGEAAIPRSLSGRLLDELRARVHRRGALPVAARAGLSAREWAVLDGLGQEKTTAQIAGQLGIADVTVRRHISSLVTKLAVRDRGELVALLRAEVSR